MRNKQTWTVCDNNIIKKTVRNGFPQFHETRNNCITAPPRITVAIQELWEMTDEQEYNRTYDHFRMWMYRRWCKEFIVQMYRGEVFKLKQNEMPLRDFVEKLFSTYKNYKDEHAIATRLLRVIKSVPPSDAELYNHAMVRPFNPKDMTLMRTMSTRPITDLASLQIVALEIADRFQPADKAGMIIRNVVQTSNMTGFSSSENKRFAKRRTPTPVPE